MSTYEHSIMLRIQEKPKNIASQSAPISKAKALETKAELPKIASISEVIQVKTNNRLDRTKNFLANEINYLELSAKSFGSGNKVQSMPSPPIKQNHESTDFRMIWVMSMRGYLAWIPIQRINIPSLIMRQSSVIVVSSNQILCLVSDMCLSFCPCRRIWKAAGPTTRRTTMMTMLSGLHDEVKLLNSRCTTMILRQNRQVTYIYQIFRLSM